MTIIAWQVDIRPLSSQVDGIRTAVDAIEGALRHADVEVRRVHDRREARLLLRTLLRDGVGEERHILHFHSVYRPAHDVLAAVARWRGIPYVVSPHSALAAPARARRATAKSMWLRLAGQSLFRGVGAVCCLSAQEELESEAVAPGSPTVVIRNPLPDDAGGQEPWTAAGSRADLVVSLSRWDVRQKGLDRLADIARHDPRLRVVVHGEQDKNEPEATATLRAGAPANFELRSPVFGAGKWSVLRSARLYAAPSRWEGFSMSVVEALAFGVPVAVSRYVARTIPVAEEGLGLVLDDDAAVAAGQLREVIADDAALEAWSRAGRAWVADACAPAAVGADLAGVYAALALKGAAAESR